MAISSSITKPFTSMRVFKLRLPRPLRRKSTTPSLETATPPPETITTTTTTTTTIKEDEFRQVFRFLDTDNDRKISGEELRAYFSLVGESVSIEEAEKMIRELSKGGEDTTGLLLGFEEFVRLMEVREGGDEVVLRQAFEVYEVEKGSGCITAEGLREVLRRLGEEKTVEECRVMIGAYDLDGNGVLDFHEFYKMMT